MASAGYLAGSFALWLLAAAFLAYGRSQSRSWSLVTGIALLALVALGAIGRGLNVADLAGAALAAATFAIKPKPTNLK